MFALAFCKSEDHRARMLFEAFAPAARLAVEAGVPLDSARDTLISALLEGARGRWPQLADRALALGRTTRAIRGLEKRADPALTRRGSNTVQRAEEALTDPLTRRELTAELPIFDGFDAAQVALAALLRTGRAAPLPARRGQPTRYQRTTPAPAAPADAPGALAAADAHLTSVADALGTDAVQTETRRVRPADHARVMAEIEAFIATRTATLAARAEGAPDAVCATVHLGAVER